MSDENMQKTIAVITARGGSKRIPRKNIKEFAGRPMIAYAIEAALSSGCFADVLVSTDDGEIAEVSRSCGASVPFMRSAATSDDYSTTEDVLREVLETCRARGEDYDRVCCVYPTAPFVTGDLLAEAYEKWVASGADALVSVVAYGHPVQRLLVIDEDRLHFKWPENRMKRTQDLQPCYHDAGQFYMIRTEALFREKTLFPADTLPLVLPETRVQDIDTPEDWELAELKYRFLHGEK